MSVLCFIFTLFSAGLKLQKFNEVYILDQGHVEHVLFDKNYTPNLTPDNDHWMTSDCVDRVIREGPGTWPCHPSLTIETSPSPLTTRLAGCEIRVSRSLKLLAVT